MIFTTNDLAKHLRISTSLLKKWRQNKIGPAYKKINDRCVIYQSDDVLKWQAEQIEILENDKVDFKQIIL
jgi:hypothetical protein